MAHLASPRRVGALALAGLTGLGFSLLSAEPGRAAPSPTPDVAPGRVVVTDLRPSAPDQAAPAPAGLDDAVAVSTYPTVVGTVRGANLALRADGTVVGWGADLAGETRPPADLTDVVDVDLGGGFALAARSDGTVVAWGGDESGVLEVPADLGSVTAVAALGGGTCGYGIALRADGTLAQWGGASCENGMPYQLPDGLSGITAVAAGDDAAIALRSDGTVVTWGPSGNLGFLDGVKPAEWTGVTQVSTQSRTFVGLTADHQTLAYGIWGEAGAPVGVTDVVSVSAGVTAAFLRADGTAYLWPSSSPTLPPAPYSAIEGGLGYVVTIVPVAPEPTPTGEPTATVEPTPTVEPTETAEPTPTVEPTETAEPTATPSPTTEPEDPAPALGSDAVEPNTEVVAPGTAQAFRFTATRDLSASRFHVYLDEQSSAASVFVGVYADAAGAPGRLISVGRLTHPTAGAWNTTPVYRARVRAGQHYWLAVLAPKRTGPIALRDRSAGEGEAAGTSARTTLTERNGLPRSWVTDATSDESPASMYLS